MQDIVDSAMSKEKALRQNPRSEAPRDIIEHLEMVEVSYVSFDALIHRGQIIVHRNVAPDVRSFFTLAHKLRFPIQKVIPISANAYAWDDVVSCTDNNSSGYNYRTIMGTKELSRHALGLAFDINPVQNVYIRYDKSGNELSRLPAYAVYDVTAPGTLTHEHPLVLHMKKLGWTWGGEWTTSSGRVDYQHFEMN